MSVLTNSMWLCQRLFVASQDAGVVTLTRIVMLQSWFAMLICWKCLQVYCWNGMSKRTGI